jgi:hypothetical protein
MSLPQSSSMAPPPPNHLLPSSMPSRVPGILMKRQRPRVQTAARNRTGISVLWTSGGFVHRHLEPFWEEDSSTSLWEPSSSGNRRFEVLKRPKPEIPGVFALAVGSAIRRTVKSENPTSAAFAAFCDLQGSCQRQPPTPTSPLSQLMLAPDRPGNSGRPKTSKFGEISPIRSSSDFAEL